jgi:hypothetical protein
VSAIKASRAVQTAKRNGGDKEKSQSEAGAEERRVEELLQLLEEEE